MQSRNNAVFYRHDTFLGVCEAIGQDFGFNPNYLRAVFSLALLFAPATVAGIYAGLGALIALSRWLFPNARAEAVIAPVQSIAPAQAERRVEEDVRIDLPMAA